MQKDQSPAWLKLRADSLADVLAYITATKRTWYRSSAEALDYDPDCDTESLQAALDLARNGWKAGTDKLVSGLGAANLLTHAAPVPFLSYDVAGSLPDVAEFCAGNPACMITYSDDSAKTKPIYRFVISLAFSSLVSGAAIINRGAAILSYVQKLELEGARCEVFALFTAEKNAKRFSVGVTLKRPDEPLELDRLAFALSNPAMLRRILFACYERQLWLENDFSSSYGAPSDAMPDDWQAPQSVYFGKVTGTNAYQFESMENALERVAQIVSDAIAG
jgi:hypothetical protein